MEEILVKIIRVNEESDKDIPLPKYMTKQSSGVDLYACIDNNIDIKPNEIVLVPTGIIVVVPYGYEAQVRPRSGLALKKGISILNTPGTIDSDYRGEIKVILINLGAEAVTVQRGDRIAQLVFAPVVKAIFLPSDKIEPSDRGEGGFGHTGI